MVRLVGVGAHAARLALGLALAAAACAPERSPVEVVEAYFRFLGRDPIRTLPLLTDAFHEQHGLHTVTGKEAHGVRAEPGRADRLAVDRCELGWLRIQSRGAFRALRDRLIVTPIHDEVQGDRARVAVRVQVDQELPFEQSFSLVREAPGRPWRIESVAQNGVAPEAALAAFVAHPTESERQRLERGSRAGP